MMRNCPNILKKVFEGENEYSIDTYLFNTDRTIFIDQSIDSDYALSIVKQLKCLSYISKDPINLMISSPGGDIDYGLSIIDEIEKCGCEVNAYALGRVASMASLIFIICNKRYMYSHSKILFHNPFYADGLGGDLNRIKYYSSCLNEMQELQNRIIKEHSKLSDEEITDICKKEQFIDSTEALNLGLIDEIVGEKCYEK